MPAASINSFFDINLASLGDRNARLASVLAEVEPSPGFTLVDSDQGVPAGVLDGRQLCSRRPLDEAARLMRDIDLVEHAAVVVLGFGMGHHVRALAEAGRKATVVVVLETDLSLLRAVFEQVDHSAWLAGALVVFITDPDDRGELAQQLDGAESILAQGVHVLEHPPSRARLGDAAARFTRNFTDHLNAAKTTLITTLMRSVDTTRNLLHNIGHYAAGQGLADLRDATAGFPAVIVSAGPSLQKNMRLLAEPGVRDRCVIIAVQTTLKPLLAAGIKPHFVTALDYHEISRRFYEELHADDVRDVTLVADPKANPVILAAYPASSRCCANGFLDKLLGQGLLHRDMGELPAGATVAHLAMYLARFLGCDPITMIGQDLGFPDGLYYAPGAVIHDVWAPELNPFNSIAMMEWQRIARHRLHLRKARDVHGKSIWTDAQMHAYLQQFERDFARYAQEGRAIFDSTEGGVAKQHTRPIRLTEFLRRFADRPLPAWPAASGVQLDATRLKRTRARIGEIRRDMRIMRQLSIETAQTIERMLAAQRHTDLASHFKVIETNRRKVEERFEAFELLNQMNQLGVFRRLKADRRLHMDRSSDPVARQRGQLQRDLDNVTWLADAADEMLDQLAQADRILAGERVTRQSAVTLDVFNDRDSTEPGPVPRVAAVIAIDPVRNGLGGQRSLHAPWGDSNVLQATLERLGASKTLDLIVLIGSDEANIDSLVDRSTIGLPLVFHRVTGTPFGPEHRAIGAGRRWAASCWRGGIAGLSVYDELLCPAAMLHAMNRHGCTAALLVGPDWPLLQVVGDQGCDAVVRRHTENPRQNNLVFTQAPPGLCGCVVSFSLMSELSQRNRLSTVGGLLTYQPHAPQHDPIAREINVHIDHEVRQSLDRFTVDSEQQHARLAAMASLSDDAGALAMRAGVEFESWSSQRPQHVIVEPTPRRSSCGIFAASFGCAKRPDLSISLAESIFGQFDQETLMTVGGGGDPLLHPQLEQILAGARQSPHLHLHLRTELLGRHLELEALVNAGLDAITVDINADRAATYESMMGVDRFKEVLLNLGRLIDCRLRLTAQKGTAAFALPWVVPALQRRAETYEDIDSFFDRWQHALGTVMIDDPPPFPPVDFGLTPATAPAHVRRRSALTTLTILSNGDVPLHPGDFTGCNIACNIADAPLSELWPQLHLLRRTRGIA